MSRAEKIKDLHFDAVLPSHLLLNQEIEPNAKILYAIVRNLTKIEGYCYARNQYLADIMDCCVATIKVWLGNLEKEGYIEVEHDTEGFGYERKIWISDNFKKSLQRLKNQPPPAELSAPPSQKISHMKEDSIKEDSGNPVVCPPTPSRGPMALKLRKRTSDGKEIEVNQDDIFRQAIAQRKDWTTGEIFEAWEALEKTSICNDGWRYIEGTIEKLRNKKKFNKMKSATDKEEKSWKKMGKEEIQCTPREDMVTLGSVMFD